MKVIFAGTPEFAVPTLNALIASSHEVITVFTQPDRPAGRGQQLQASPIKQIAEKTNIPVYQPASLRDEAIQAHIKKLQPAVIVVVAYGLILPKAVLDIPKYGCINIHPSLLPRWRGAAPIQRTIEAGDKETAVTIMQMDKGMDTGPILLQEKMMLQGNETSGSLHDVCAEKGAELLLKVLNDINTIEPIAQSDAGITHAKKVEKSEGKINFEKSVDEIDAHIRAMTPWPSAMMAFQNETIKILSAKIVSHGKSSHVVGVLFREQDKLCISAKDGVLEILMLQLPGKKPVAAKDFLRGYKV